MHRGENGAPCTRSTRQWSEGQFSGGPSSFYSQIALASTTAAVSSSKNINSRKIDMMIISETGHELALCEFKRNNDEMILRLQQGKNARLNQCVTKVLEQFNIFQPLISMNWGGK
jgi:hypothetical protein